MTERGSEPGVPATSVREHLEAIDDRLAAIGDAADELELLALNADLQTAKAGSSDLPVVYREVRQAARRTARATDAIEVSLSALRDRIDADEGPTERGATTADGRPATEDERQATADGRPASGISQATTGPERAETAGQPPEPPWASADGRGATPRLPPGRPDAVGTRSEPTGTRGDAMSGPETSPGGASGRVDGHRSAVDRGSVAFRLGAGTPERSFVPERGRRARARSDRADDVPESVREYALDDDELDWEELLSLAEATDRPE